MSATITTFSGAFLCGWHRQYFGCERWIDKIGNPVPAPNPLPPENSISHGMCVDCAPIWRRKAGIEDVKGE